MEKALQRARLGREEAEEENAMLKERITEFMKRETKVGLRLEEGMVSLDLLVSNLWITED